MQQVFETARFSENTQFALISKKILFIIKLSVRAFTYEKLYLTYQTVARVFRELVGDFPHFKYDNFVH